MRHPPETFAGHCNPTMIIYAVILETDESLGGQLEDYMRSKHIPDVLATGCFSGAELARCGGGVYRISYRARNPESLEEYLAEHTQGLRKSFSAEAIVLAMTLALSAHLVSPGYA